MKNFNLSLLGTALSIALLIPVCMTGQTTLITEVFQPNGVGGQDAIVSNLINCSQSANYHNINYGNVPVIMAREWSFNQVDEDCDDGTTRTFIRFDEINFIPNNAIITMAELFLYADPNSSANANNPSNAIEIGRVTGSWNEQTLTWANMPPANYSDGITHVASTQSHEDISIVVTPIIQSQVSGNNNGFLIKLITENKYSRWTWASSDNANSALHPKLIVKYYLPCDGNFTYCYNTATSGFTFSTNTVEPNTGYIWSFGDGSGTSTIGQTVNHTYSAPGNYTVCHEVKGGDCRVCVSICVTSDQVPQALPKANTEDKSNENENEKHSYVESLYPNPTKGEITLEVNAISVGVAGLTIYDLTGKKLVTKNYNLEIGINQLEFNLPKLAPGIYICTILMEGEYIEQKFLVE